MRATASDILQGAYNRSDANDPGKLAQDPELLAHLNRVYQRAWALVARSRPDEYVSMTALTLAGIPPAASLPADVIDVIDVATSTGAPVRLIPLVDRWRSWQLAPCVYRQGMSLVSRNSGSGDPQAGAVLTVALLGAPAALTTLAAQVDARWPARHVQLLVDALALYLSTKDTGRSPAEHAKIQGEAQQSALAFAAEYALAPEAVEWLHGPAERAPKGSA